MKYHLYMLRLAIGTLVTSLVCSQSVTAEDQKIYSVQIPYAALERLTKSELWRVGCLFGESENGWGATEREAAAAFLSGIGEEADVQAPNSNLLGQLASAPDMICTWEDDLDGAESTNCFSYNGEVFCDDDLEVPDKKSD